MSYLSKEYAAPKNCGKQAVETASSPNRGDAETGNETGRQICNLAPATELQVATERDFSGCATLRIIIIC
jgi:hypothetical protein